MTQRQAGLDYLRGFVVVLVVLHHAVLAYCRFGYFDTQHYLWSTAPIVDADRWAGFDILVLFNDSFFMPLMFLLSGLFVGPSLRRKGPRAYVLDRLRRLGLPFVLAALVVMPVAYYPSYRMTGSTIGFSAFWVQTIFDGPWPNGPAWFVGVLLVFDVLVAVVQPWLPRWRLSFGGLAALSLVTFLPLLIGFGPVHWFTFGPFAVQASRVLLYAAYFFAGVSVGPAIRPGGRGRIALALALFAVLLAEQVYRSRDPGALPGLVWLVLYGVALALFCAAATLAMLGVFAGLTRPRVVLDRLSRDAYGIYLLHYPFIVWGQYALLEARVGAVSKALMVFAGSLTFSWFAAAGVGALVRCFGKSSVSGRGDSTLA